MTEEPIKATSNHIKATRTKYQPLIVTQQLNKANSNKTVIKKIAAMLCLDILILM